MVSVLVRLAIVASAMLAASCSLVVDPDQVQCEVTEDCAAINHPDSRCIENLCTGSFKMDCSEVPWIDENDANGVAVSIGAFSLETVAVPNVEFKVCGSGDPECSMGGTTSAPTDQDGRTSVNVSEGFRGRFFAASTTPLTRAPYFLHMNPPPDPSKEDTLLPNVTVIGLGQVSGIATTVGVTHKPELGHLFFAARDCQGDILPGVSVFAEGAQGVEVAYLGNNRIPDPSLTETGIQGGGAMINIPVNQVDEPPRTHTITAYHNNKKIFQQPLLFAPGVITSTQIVPSDY
jgi:hypothetical protein